MTTGIIAIPRKMLTKGLKLAIAANERALRSLRSAYRSLTGREAPVRPLAGGAEKRPAVPIDISVTPDYIVCLEDGKRFKMLKGHLRSAYDMSPEEYREKWGLPENYPMVAPNYREKRVRMAKDMGLGHMRKPRTARGESRSDRRSSTRAA